MQANRKAGTLPFDIASIPTLLKTFTHLLEHGKLQGLTGKAQEVVSWLRSITSTRGDGYIAQLAVAALTLTTLHHGLPRVIKHAKALSKQLQVRFPTMPRRTIVYLAAFLVLGGIMMRLMKKHARVRQTID